MDKFILLGASWCPVTKETLELFEELRKERSDFDYEYINIDSKEGESLVKKFSVTDIPKTIFRDKIIFHGLPSKEKLLVAWEKRILPRQLQEKEKNERQRQN